MKYIFSLILALISSVGLFAQITVTNADMPSAGDTIRTSSSIDIGLINFEETGNDFTWDFSSLMPFSQDVDTFVSISETPWLYQLLFLTSANMAQSGMGFEQVPGYEVTDYYDFYNNTTSSFDAVGFGVTLNAFPIPNKFLEPDKIFQFPLEYGNIDTSLAVHEMAIPGLGYFGGWKNRINEVDGYGTLITPYGTFETIRVKSYIQQFDSIYVDSLGFGFPMYQEFVEYKWLGSDFGLPLVEVKDDGIVTNITYVDSVRNLTVGLNESIADRSINIYPNPAKNSFTVEIDLDKRSDFELQLFDFTGRLLTTIHENSISANYKRTIDLQNLKLQPGLYLVTISLSDSLIKRKLIIQ